MKAIGILLIVIGLVGLLWGGITYIKDRDTAELGPVEIVVEEKERISIPPVIGAIALISGALIVGLSGRRPRVV